MSTEHLPALVRGYVSRALPLGGHVPRHVRVGQTGQKWLKPGGRSLRFTAVEEFAVRKVDFSWRAGFPLLPFVTLEILDGYTNGKGKLEGRLLGRLPVMRRRGPDVDRGEALRYLAELAWVPQAMVANRELEWRVVDERVAEVATAVGATRAAVKLHFDDAGDVVAVWCVARPRTTGKLSVPTLGRVTSETSASSPESAIRHTAKSDGSYPRDHSPTGAARSPRSTSTRPASSPVQPSVVPALLSPLFNGSEA